jgi:nicotinamidase-related amidase
MPGTALLVMDLQAGIISRMPSLGDYISRVAKTIAEARAVEPKISIIYVGLSFQPGHPEVSPSNPTFYAAAQQKMFLAGSPGTAFHPDIAPAEGDVVVFKKRISAFTGSGLDLILSSLGVKNLVLCGLSTGGVVLSTLVEAVDKDFGITVLEDLCMDPDEEVHRVLTEKTFKKRGAVVKAKEWINGLKTE